MFWKKKKRIKLLQEPPLDHRRTFRYEFQASQPFHTQFLNQKVKVINLSAGGIAFMDKGFNQYDIDRIQLDLSLGDRKHPPFVADARILSITSDSVCHCIFEGCMIDDYERVHQYVWERQKQDLQHKVKHDTSH